MKAAMVVEAGKGPVWVETAAPVAETGEVLVQVTAAAMSHVTKGRASGRHYRSQGTLPLGVGIDGVGRTEDGRRVYFVLPRAPFGAMAEVTVVREAQCVSVPDGLDDVTAAAMANPGMSSWAAYAERAKLKAGETVLVNGATGTSGRLAVQIAKWMGAKRVIATGRNRAALEELQALGADVVIPLVEDAEAMERSFLPVFEEGVDVVVDYLWGASAERLLVAAAKAGPEGVPMRFVQVGSLSGGEIRLPSAVLRSSAIELMGSGIGSVPVERLLRAVQGVLAAVVPGGFRIAVSPRPMAEVERAWDEDDSSRRTVFVVG